MPRPSCETCHFAESAFREGDGAYRCHLNPPTYSGEFPRVLRDMWCGSHRPAATEPVPPPHPQKVTRPASAPKTRG